VAVTQSTEEGFLLVAQLRSGQLLREAPDLPSARDRRVVVEIHRMDVPAFLDLARGRGEAHGDDLSGLGIVAEARRVRHADELVGDRVPDDLERLGHHGTEQFGIGPIGDDDEFAIVEAVGRFRVSRIVERHGEGFRAHV
jgi:hypothetical protein